MTLPDTHCFDEDTQQDVWSYSRELVEQMLAERDAVLRQALSALEYCEEGLADGRDITRVHAKETMKKIREVLK